MVLLESKLRTLVMEYIAGGIVEWSDTDHSPLLTLAQTRRVMRDVILGLEYREQRSLPPLPLLALTRV